MNIPNETKEHLNQIFGTKGIWDDGVAYVLAGRHYAQIGFNTYHDAMTFVHIWNCKIVDYRATNDGDEFDILNLGVAYPKVVKHLIDRYNRFFKVNIIHHNIVMGRNEVVLELLHPNGISSIDAALAKPLIVIDELAMGTEPRYYKAIKQGAAIPVRPDLRVRDASGPEPHFRGWRTSNENLNNAVDIERYTSELKKLVDGVTVKAFIDKDLVTRIKNGEKKSMSFMYNYQNLYPKKIHFSGPCTIAIWPDGTKTIVRIKDGDMSINDPEKAIAMVCLKKFMGGHNFRKLFKEYMPEEEEESEVCEEVTDNQNEPEVREEVADDHNKPDSANSDLGGSEDVQNINLEE